MEVIGRFDAQRIKDIAVEVAGRAKRRRDVVVDRKELAVVQADKELCLRMAGQDTLLSFRRESLLQLAETLKVPAAYLNRLTGAGHTDMVARDLTDLLAREPKRHLVRQLDGQVDAVLSDSYRAISNESVMDIVLAEAKRAGAEIWDFRLTRDEFRILLAAPHVSGAVTLDRTFDRGDGWKLRWQGRQGDTVNAAITIGNGETGKTRFSVQPSILRQVCANFCVWSDGVAQVHLGRKLDAGEQFYSKETRDHDDQGLMMKVRDLIRTTFDPVSFKSAIDRMNATTQVNIDAPIAAVDASIKAFGLPLERREAILEELLGSGDKTQYGLCQAITAQANPQRVGSLDDAARSAFEDAGGALLGMPVGKFQRLVAAGA